MARGRFIPQTRETGKRLRINDMVRISPIRLIDENNEQVGVVDLDDAKNRAREAGLDLVEVSPNSDPPVCRIMDYGKWKYQQQKKESKAKSHAKQSELKEVRLRPSTDDHDLKLKMEKAAAFIEDGHKVQFTMLFRGRQMAHQDLARDTMYQIRDELSDLAKEERPPRMSHRRMTMVVAPYKAGEGRKKAPAPGSPPSPPAQRPAAASPPPPPTAPSAQDETPPAEPLKPGEASRQAARDAAGEQTPASQAE